jgi:abortive infection bacteriophage resistance protein
VAGYVDSGGEKHFYGENMTNCHIRQKMKHTMGKILLMEHDINNNATYSYRRKNIRDYLAQLYMKGIGHSNYLSSEAVEKIVANIGIFKFKGYIYAFQRYPDSYTIDDVLTVYYFDKFLTRHVIELTASIETLLKTRVIELCYKWTDNPFFYLLQENHKFKHFHINQPTLENWRNKKKRDGEAQEHYAHYGLYYKSTYSFRDNQSVYLQSSCIEIHDEVNYPPFHYLVESATLGALISLIKSIKVGKYDLLHGIAKEFGVNPKLFGHYLDRLNEVRNRAAHRERLFNRGYRSVRAFGQYHSLRKAMEPHCFADVYLYLYFMLGRVDSYINFEDYCTKETMPLFDEYRIDRLIALDSQGLNQKMDDEDFGKMMQFIHQKMGIKKASHNKVT